MKTTSVSSSLGLTQKELAMLLHISRSQLSMFELGKGNLPASATILLAELLTLAQAAATHTKNKTQHKLHNPQREQEILKVLKENEFQYLLTQKKMEAAKRKETNQNNLSQFANYLEKLPAAKNVANEKNLTYITTKSAKVQAATGSSIIEKYALQLELLAIEKEYLESLLSKE